MPPDPKGSGNAGVTQRTLTEIGSSAGAWVVNGAHGKRRTPLVWAHHRPAAASEARVPTARGLIQEGYRSVRKSAVKVEPSTRGSVAHLDHGARPGEQPFEDPG